jgi:transposase
VRSDRTTAGTADWLSQHPEIAIISRDRCGLYAQGAREGAPQARQIADSSHLCKIAWKRFYTDSAKMYGDIDDDPRPREPRPLRRRRAERAVRGGHQSRSVRCRGGDQRTSSSLTQCVQPPIRPAPVHELPATCKAMNDENSDGPH